MRCCTSITAKAATCSAVLLAWMGLLAGVASWAADPPLPPPPPPPSTTALPVVLLLIDQSGSLRTSDPRRSLIEAAQVAVALSGEHTRLGVITFAENAETLAPPAVLATPEDRQRLSEVVESILYVGEQARLDEALAAASTVLERAEAPPGSRIIICTDGPGEDNPQAVLRRAAKLAERGWVVDGIRIDNQRLSEQPFFAQTCAATGGTLTKTPAGAHLAAQVAGAMQRSSLLFAVDVLGDGSLGATLPAGCAMTVLAYGDGSAVPQAVALLDQAPWPAADQPVFRLPLKAPAQAPVVSVARAAALPGRFTVQGVGAGTWAMARLPLAIDRNQPPIVLTNDDSGTRQAAIRVRVRCLDAAGKALLGQVNVQVVVLGGDGSALSQAIALHPAEPTGDDPNVLSLSAALPLGPNALTLLQNAGPAANPWRVDVRLLLPGLSALASLPWKADANATTIVTPPPAPTPNPPPGVVTNPDPPATPVPTPTPGPTPGNPPPGVLVPAPASQPITVGWLREAGATPGALRQVAAPQWLGQPATVAVGAVVANLPSDAELKLALPKGVSAAPLRAGEQRWELTLTPAQVGPWQIELDTRQALNVNGSPVRLAALGVQGEVYAWAGGELIELPPSGQGPIDVSKLVGAATRATAQPLAAAQGTLTHAAGATVLANLGGDGQVRCTGLDPLPAGELTGSIELRFGSLPPRVVKLHLAYVPPAPQSTFAATPWTFNGPAQAEQWLRGEDVFTQTAGLPGQLTASISDLVGPNNEKLTAAFDLRVGVGPVVQAGARAAVQLDVWRSNDLPPGDYSGSISIRHQSDNGVATVFTRAVTVRLP